MCRGLAGMGTVCYQMKRENNQEPICDEHKEKYVCIFYTQNKWRYGDKCRMLMRGSTVTKRVGQIHVTKEQKEWHYKQIKVGQLNETAPMKDRD